MKKIFAIAVAFTLVLGFASFAAAGWEKCEGCHNGNIAKSTKQMLVKKFKTTDALIKGAKESPNPMMNAWKDKEDDLKTAAKDLKLK